VHAHIQDVCRPVGGSKGYLAIAPSLFERARRFRACHECRLDSAGPCPLVPRAGARRPSYATGAIAWVGAR